MKRKEFMLQLFPYVSGNFSWWVRAAVIMCNVVSISRHISWFCIVTPGPYSSLVDQTPVILFFRGKLYISVFYTRDFKLSVIDFVIRWGRQCFIPKLSSLSLWHHSYIRYFIYKWYGKERPAALTLKCRKGGPLGPNFTFFAPPVRTGKDFSPSFFCNCLNISYASFGEKKSYRQRRFHLISIN